MKKFSIAMLSMVLAGSMLLTGCGGSKTADSSSDAQDSTTSTSADGGTLRMGTNATFPPYEFVGDDGNVQGIDVDIAAAIADKLGMKLEVTDMEFDSLIPALQSDTVDVALAGMTVTPDRQENVDFSDSYAKGVQVIIVKDGSDIASPEDLEGKNIGVPGLADAGTLITKRSLNAEDIDISDGSSEVTFTVFSRNDLAQALQNKAVDAIVLGDPQAAVAQDQYGLTALIDTATDPTYKDEYCCDAFVTSKLAEENPEAAAAFTRAVQKGAQWVEEHPEETAKIIVDKKYTAGDADLLAAILETYNYKPSVQGGYDALKLGAEQLTEIGILKEGTDATKFADNAYIFFDDVPDAPERDTSTDTATESAKGSSVSFQPAAAAAEEGDCCGGGAATKPAQSTKA